MLAAAASFAVAVHAQSGGRAAAQAMQNPVPPTPASVTAGEAAFKKYCAFCHGVDAKGDGPLAPEGSNPPDLTDETWAYGSTDGEIFSVMEEAYRGQDISIALRSGDLLTIPEDLVFLMTMNNLDKSTEDLDDALFGRIAAVEFPPREDRGGRGRLR